MLRPYERMLPSILARVSILLVLLLALLAFAGVCAGGWLLWRRADDASRRLIKRVSRLPLRGKLRLALALARDRRIPLPIRGLPPALVLYLALPLDIVPDFIPVLGQLDDLLILGVGLALLLRFTPRQVLEERIALLETP